MVLLHYLAPLMVLNLRAKLYGARLTRYKVPRIGFVNKMDRSGADF